MENNNETSLIGLLFGCGAGFRRPCSFPNVGTSRSKTLEEIRAVQNKTIWPEGFAKNHCSLLLSTTVQIRDSQGVLLYTLEIEH